MVWGDAGTGSARVLIDDHSLSDLAYDGFTMDTPRLDLSIWGLNVATAPASRVGLWIDELVIATQPIGCAN